MFRRTLSLGSDHGEGNAERIPRVPVPEHGGDRPRRIIPPPPPSYSSDVPEHIFMLDARDATDAQKPQPMPHRYQVVPYDEYLREVYCFTTGNNPSAQEKIRDYMQRLCREMAVKLHTGAVRTPKDAIPQGTWTLGFAPAILDSGGWFLIFAVPQDSETVWYYWAETKGSEESMLALLTRMSELGEIKAEDTMIVGGERHERFHGIASQVVWSEENVMEMDWRSGEFREVLE